MEVALRPSQEIECVPQRPHLALFLWSANAAVDRLSRLGLRASGVEGLSGRVSRLGRGEVWSAQSRAGAERVAAGLVERPEPRGPLYHVPLGYRMEGIGFGSQPFQVPP